MRRLREVSQERLDRIAELPQRRHKFHLWWLQRYSLREIREMSGALDTLSDRAKFARHAPQRRLQKVKP